MEVTLDENGAVEGGQQKRITPDKIQICSILKYFLIISIIHFVFVELVEGYDVSNCLVVGAFILTIKIPKQKTNSNDVNHCRQINFFQFSSLDFHQTVSYEDSSKTSKRQNNMRY